MHECNSLHCVSYKSKSCELSYKYGGSVSVNYRELSRALKIRMMVKVETNVK